MSAADDVFEMQHLCETLAEKLTRSLREKVRIRAIRSRVLTPNNTPAFGENRVLEFLRGRARRVDSWEKDLVRKELERIAEAERMAELQKHVRWLRRTTEYLRATDEELHGLDIDAIEQAVRVAGAEGGPLVALASEGLTPVPSHGREGTE